MGPRLYPVLLLVVSGLPAALLPAAPERRATLAVSGSALAADPLYPVKAAG